MRRNVAIYHATLPSVRGKKGGVEASVHRLATSLVSRGNVDVTVFSSGNPPLGALYSHRSILNLSNSRRLTRLFISPLLLNALNLSKFDVIHFHGDDWFCLPRGTPTVRTFHGSALHEARFATRLNRRCMMYVVYQLERLSAAKASYKVGVNKETAQIYKCEAYIGNGVDLALFRPQEKDRVPTVSYVGTWAGRKRGEFLAKTFLDYVLPDMPSARLRMISDECIEHPSIDHITNASDADVASTIAGSWVFAYPSTYEGFGIPYVEALSCGTPILTSRNGGALEILNGGEFGSIVSDAEFGPELLRLLKDPDLRSYYAKNGLGRAELYSDDEIAKQYEEIYNKLSGAIR
jgi:phosphatidylinositol alpha-mannosyltransferase